MPRCGGCGSELAVLEYYKAEIENYTAMYLDICTAQRQYVSSLGFLNDALATCADCIQIDGVSPYAKNIKALIKDVTQNISDIEAQKETLLDKLRVAGQHRDDAQKSFNACDSEDCPPPPPDDDDDDD